MSCPQLTLQQTYRDCNSISQSIKSFNHWVGSKAEKNIAAKDIDLSGRAKITFSEFHMSAPTYYDMVDRVQRACPLFPTQARRSLLTYAGDAYVNVNITIGDRTMVDPRVSIGRIPAMTRSSVCHLSRADDDALRRVGESPINPGGYFIIRGIEKAIMYQELLAVNRPMIVPIDERPQCRQTINTPYGTSLFYLSLGKQTGVIKAVFDKLDKQNQKSRKAKINVIRVFRVLGDLTINEIYHMIAQNIPKDIRAACMDQLEPNISEVIGLDNIADDVRAIMKHLPALNQETSELSQVRVLLKA